ncbi:MAG TPA: LptF/LptG family permease, partial [Bacteroidota bacterium]|nr:LptF/LptG family permease [Bacteroidota bacterium]
MRLHFHILRTHLGPFIFSFFILMFIFLLQFIMKFIDQLVGKGLSVWVISELIVLNLSWMVVLAVPMSVLVATLMAFGSLSTHHEVTAMKASGMSLYRMMSTTLLAAIILTLLLIEFNNKILPEANHRAKTLIIDIRRTKPTLTIVPGLFSQDIAGYSILARRTFEHSNDLEGITIYDYTEPTTNVVVTAEQGKISFTPDYRKLIMDLYNGEIHQLKTNELQNYRRMRYQKH